MDQMIKNLAKIILIGSISMLTLFFSPGKYESRTISEECINPAADSTSSNVLIPSLALDGFSVFCTGFSYKLSEVEKYGCNTIYENICFGLVTGTGAAPSPFEAKFNFIKEL